MKKLVIVLLISHLLAGMAWACEGWVLVVPPHIGSVILHDQPISKWPRDRTFDTAEACEAERRRMIKEWAKAGDDATRTLQVKILFHAECVPGSVVYGKEMP